MNSNTYKAANSACEKGAVEKETWSSLDSIPRDRVDEDSEAEWEAWASSDGIPRDSVNENITYNTAISTCDDDGGNQKVNIFANSMQLDRIDDGTAYNTAISAFEDGEVKEE